jgi:Lon protease-like protein
MTERGDNGGNDGDGGETRDEGGLSNELRSALVDLPVFPLPEAILFPGALLPLHIFEPRYRAMLAHCLETHRAMVIARICDGKEPDAEGRPRFESIAGLGVIVRHQALPDGRANIVLQGRARVSIEERPSDAPFRRVSAVLRADAGTIIPATDRAALIAAATAFASALESHPDLAFAFPPDAAAQTIADLCAQHLLFDADVRQAVLEERDVAIRVRRVTSELTLQRYTLTHGAGGNDKRRALN